MYALNGSYVTGYVLACKGNLLINPSAKTAAVFSDCMYLSPGIVT